jgi:hypothetical protein
MKFIDEKLCETFVKECAIGNLQEVMRIMESDIKSILNCNIQYLDPHYNNEAALSKAFTNGHMNVINYAMNKVNIYGNYRIDVIIKDGFDVPNSEHGTYVNEYRYPLEEYY